ncbi:hypothetical protein LXL04_037491 [Taraxacum kok-saghyz]
MVEFVAVAGGERGRTGQKSEVRRVGYRMLRGFRQVGCPPASDKRKNVARVQVAACKQKHQGNISKKDGTKLKDGEPGVLHGAITKLLKEDEGHTIHDTLNPDPGCNYPRVGPEYHGTSLEAWNDTNSLLFTFLFIY